MIAPHIERTRWALPLLLVLIACSVDPKANNRYHAPNCPKGQFYRGFCKEVPDASVSAPDASADSGGGAAKGGGGSGGASAPGDDGGTSDDLTGKSCAGATMAAYCYLGPSSPKKTDNVGICHGGHRDCVNGKWTECLGQVLPEKEQCNGLDDNCDGDNDNDVEPKPCNGCGGTTVCTKGHEICKKGQGVTPPEICNGKDDNCDGLKDNDVAPVPCADDNSGCTDSGGVIACKGICHWGTKTCSGGKLGECEDQTFPKAKDPCNGLNDDCDDSIDEDCTCTPGTSVPCYGGSADTLDKDGNPKGECRKGTQMCGDDGKYGACDGEQRPKAEDCSNIDHDDDCDGTIDEDIAGLDESCASSASSECSGTNKCVGGELKCVPPAMMDEVCNKLDDDCDNYIDEDFDTSTDNDNCGGCGKKCDVAAGQQCCGGACTDTTTDPKNCGGCGLPCGNSLSCCNNTCVDLHSTNKMNCGSCGHACTGTQQCCSGVCFDPQTDESHCGGCSKPACASGQTCCSGACVLLGVGGICI